MDIISTIIVCFICIWFGVTLTKYFRIKTSFRELLRQDNYLKFVVKELCVQLDKQGFPVQNFLNDLSKAYKKEDN